ncbi:class I SAM-dependent methyltransferase [candidate division KSB1 bacterium]|nr:class I SAM-dependent methyltransferase [candidate division KSB1 bacterium]
MFTHTAHLYDLIYTRMKDYAAEAHAVHELIQSSLPGARSLLDIACGTGEHAKWLHGEHGYEVFGIDLDSNMVAISQAKCPECRFLTANMVDFEVAERFDAAICLFGSIGYLTDLADVAQAFERVRSHLKPGGVFLLEPFLSPEQYQPGSVFMEAVDQEQVKLCRMSVSSVHDRIGEFHFEYLVGRPAGIVHLTETHTLRLSTIAELQSALERAGFQTAYREPGLRNRGRGLFVCVMKGA